MSIFDCAETISAPKKYVKRHIEQRLVEGARYRAMVKAAADDAENPPTGVAKLFPSAPPMSAYPAVVPA